MTVWRVLGLSVAVLLAVYFLWFAVRYLDPRALDSLADWSVLSAVLTAAALYALVIPISAWAWQALLRGQNENRPLPELTVIMAVTQLAKYVPGNIAQFAGRMIVSVRAGMSARAVASTIVHEQVLAIAASVVVGLLALYLAGVSAPLSLPAHAAWLVALAVLLMTMVVVLAVRRFPPEQLLAHRSMLVRLAGKLGGMPGPSVVASAFTAYCLNYLLVGLGLWLIAMQMGLGDEINFALATSVFALSWSLGFLTPGAPAGLGVREGIMALLLAGSPAPAAQILLFILVVRIATVLGDAACFGVGWVWSVKRALREGGRRP